MNEREPSEVSGFMDAVFHDARQAKQSEQIEELRGVADEQLQYTNDTASEPVAVRQAQILSDERYTSHFATCPNAADHRRRR